MSENVVVQQAQDMKRFIMIYAFVIFIVAFCMALSVYIVWLDHTKIDIIITFWLTGAAASAIGYLIGSSITKTPAPLTKQDNSASVTITPEAKGSTEEVSDIV